MAIVIGVSYGAGIMISNGYLASLGVTDFDLLRPKAVLTGLWFIAFFAVSVVADRSIEQSFQMKQIPRSWRVGNALIAFCGAYFFYFLAFIFSHMGKHASGAVVRGLISVPFLMFVSAGSAVMWAHWAAKEWGRRKTDRKVGPSSAAFFLGQCGVSALAVVYFATLFITHFYKVVPQEFGGAMPRPVTIAVTDKAASALKGMSVVTTNNVLEGPTELIHETGDDVVLRSNGSTTIILPRREILAIRIR